MGPSLKTILYWMVAALVIFLFWNVSSRIQREEQHISYSEFLRQADAGGVSEVTITSNDTGSQVVGQFISGLHFRTFAPPQAYGLVERMLELGVEVHARGEESTSWARHLISWTPILVMIAFFVFFMKAARGAHTPNIHPFEKRLEAKARALRDLSASAHDLSEEEMMSCLLADTAQKDQEPEARKALYEMLAEGTVVVTAERKYRLKTTP